MNNPNLFNGDLPVEDRIVADITFDNSTAYTTPGEFETLRSAPSNVFKLHDGEYYQDFSYVLKTNVPLVTFEAPVLALLHPAGTSMFAQPNIVSDASSALNNTGSFLYQYSKPDGVNYNNPEANSGRKYFDVEVNLYNPQIQISPDHSTYMVLGVFFNSYAYRSVDLRWSSQVLHFIIDKTLQYTPRKQTTYKTLTISNSTPYNVDADLLLSNKNLFIANKFKTANVASEEVRNYIINKSIDSHQVDIENFTTLDKIGNSSKFLWEIGTTKMDDLDDISKMYGLSPGVAYSNVTLSP